MSRGRFGSNSTPSTPRFLVLWVILLAGMAGLGGLPGTAASAAPPANTISVHPRQIHIGHPRFPQVLVVGRDKPDGTHEDLTRDARYLSADPQVARVDNQGRVWPVGPGQTTISVSVAGQSLQIPVTSQPPASAPEISYLHEVQPILSKTRCNQGACHGYSLGKNGFKLSLRGADAVADYVSLTKEFHGRRILQANPAASLLVTKPVGDVPHQGGNRFRKDSDPYRRLTQWIAEGAPSDLASTVELTQIEVTPSYVVLPKPGSQQQLQVTARYSDGTSRDITSLAIFTSSHDDRADVTDNGLVRTLARGDVTIQVRYERVFVVANIVCLDDTPGFVWSNPPTRNFIDDRVFSRLKDLRINPSDLSSDSEFLRRVYLDMIGTPPTVEEQRAFVADSTPDKRDRLIEALFARPEYVDHWSMKWGDLLQNSRRYVSEESMFAFRDWIRHAMASNMPLDKFARDILTGQGAVRDNATAAYYRVSNDPKVNIERTAQVFTGIRMLCARCHPHPHENWTQADYFGMVSFFNQVTEKPDYIDPQKDKIILVNRNTGFATNPRTNKPQPPRFLGGGEPKVELGIDRRPLFADWLTSRENPLFARSIVNRYWSYFFSRGIIDPVDDMRVTNPPINPALLDTLTQDFVAHNFDTRHLIRTIVQSRTYQLSSKTNPTNAHDSDHFSHALPRRLTAEQLLDSASIATGIQENISGAPAGFRASQLPDTNVTSEFLELFGKAQRQEACECERTTDTNMLQALHMINGNTLLQKVTSPSSRVAQLANNPKLTPEQRIEDLYLATLCRPPTQKELQASLAYVNKSEKPLEAYQDLTWALMNTSDFWFVR